MKIKSSSSSPKRLDCIGGVLDQYSETTEKKRRKLQTKYKRNWEIELQKIIKELKKWIYKKIIELSFILSWEECKD